MRKVVFYLRALAIVGYRPRRLVYYLRCLRRYDEALATEHVLLFRVVPPVVAQRGRHE